MIGWILFAVCVGFGFGCFIGIGLLGWHLQEKYGEDWEERLKK